MIVIPSICRLPLIMSYITCDAHMEQPPIPKPDKARAMSAQCGCALSQRKQIRLKHFAEKEILLCRSLHALGASILTPRSIGLSNNPIRPCLVSFLWSALAMSDQSAMASRKTRRAELSNHRPVAYDNTNLVVRHPTFPSMAPSLIRPVYITPAQGEAAILVCLVATRTAQHIPHHLQHVKPSILSIF